MVEAALVAGICAEGANVLLAGVVPTPAVAHLARVRDAPAAVISASHNPFQDNGVKLFAPGWPQDPRRARASRRTRAVELLAETAPPPGPAGTRRRRRERAARRGRRVRHPSGRRARGPASSTVSMSSSTAATARRSGPRRVCCASSARGSTCCTRRRTARTSTGTAVRPTRRSCRARWSLQGADAGLAFDGDADRVIAVDATERSSTATRSCWSPRSTWWSATSSQGNAVVATVMSNLGLGRALAEHGIELVEVPVGDRNVIRRAPAAWVVPRWRAVGAHHLLRPRHDRRRHVDGGTAPRRRPRDRPAASGGWRR